MPDALSIRGEARRGRRAVGLSWHLMLPIAVVAIPLVLLAAVVVLQQYRVERARAETRLLDYARSLASMVDREFAQDVAIGQVLANSTSLANGDRQGCERELREATAMLNAGLPAGPDRVFIDLRDAHHSLRLSTSELAPASAALSELENVDSVIASGKPEISNLSVAPNSGLPRVVVSVPVRLPASATGQPPMPGVLSVGVPHARLLALLTQVRLPRGSAVSLLDRQGVVVARSLHDSETVGKLPMPAVLKGIMHATSGVLPPGTVTLEHTKATITFAHAPVSGYIVKIDIPEAVFVAPLRAALLPTAIIGTLVATLGLGLAAIATRRVVGAFRHVAVAAESAANPASPNPISLGVREADQLAALLGAALGARAAAAASARALFDSSPLGIAIANADGAIASANDAFMTLFALPRSRAGDGTLRWEALVGKEWLELDRVAVTSSRQGAPLPPIRQECIRPDGTVVPVLVSFGPTGRDDASVAIFVADMTSQRAAEDSLRNMVAQLSLFVDRTPAGIAMFDREMRYLAVSRRYLRDYHLPVEDPAELIGRSHYDIFPELPPRWRDIHRSVLAGETQSADEEAFPRPDGRVDWVRWEMTPLPRRDGTIAGAILFSEVVTDRKEAENARRESEELLRQVVETSPNALVVTRTDGVVVMVNRQVEQVFGFPRDEVLGHRFDILVPPRHRVHHRSLHNAFLQQPRERPMGSDTKIWGYRRDGSEVPLDIGLSLVKSAAGDLVLSTITDISERLRNAEALRRSEEQLRQAQKMEAIGNLTGGLAHDFNNLLGIVIGNLDMAEPLVSHDTDARELIHDALDAALRGADLTGRLLAFARRQTLNPQPIDLNGLVGGMVKLLARTLGETIKITLDLSADLWTVVADPAQLEAAIANLATNARDAMARGGTLRIATANRHLDADYVAQHPDLAVGDYAMVEVSDTGSGMTKEVAARIFEPFFTTKEPGKGTGLGLSMVFGFLKQSSGHINLYSEPKVGTTFRLYLPRAKDAVASLLPPEEPEIPMANGETVLVVEDNEALRRVVLRQIASMGYRAIAAWDAATALEMLEREAVDLVFTDVVMPGERDGFALEREINARWPSIRVVLTSGFPESRQGAEAPAQVALSRILNKPYQRSELARVLREALADRSC